MISVKWRRDGAFWSCCLVTKSGLILCNPKDCSPPGSSVRGISQARTLEWVAISFSRTSFELKDRTRVSHLLALAGRFRYHWATWEARNTTKQFQLCSLSCWLNCEPAALNGKLSFPLSSYHSWQRFWLYLQDTTLYPYDLKKWTGKHPCGANGRRTRWSCKKTIYNDPSMTHSLHSPRP